MRPSRGDLTTNIHVAPSSTYHGLLVVYVETRPIVRPRHRNIDCHGSRGTLSSVTIMHQGSAHPRVRYTLGGLGRHLVDTHTDDDEGEDNSLGQGQFDRASHTQRRLTISGWRASRQMYCALLLPT